MNEGSTGGVAAALPAVPRAAGADGSARAGVVFGTAAYAFWGLVPVYFKALADVAPLEILAHRIVWSVVLLALLMLVRRGWGAALAAVRAPRTLLTLAGTALLIAGNWLGFIWAVTNDQVRQASLGYFINPLVNVVLGYVFLRERLTRRQAWSVGLAAAGVAYLTVAGGRFPALGLFLACTFGLYGLLRKTTSVDALAGQSVETALLAPLALAFLVVESARGRAALGSGSPLLDVLLIQAGLVTATPLLCFAAAARRLRLATLGFLQYLAPTGHLLLALAYGEPIRPALWVAFGFIWVALAIYTVDAVARTRPPRGPIVAPPAD